MALKYGYFALKIIFKIFWNVLFLLGMKRLKKVLHVKRNNLISFKFGEFLFKRALKRR